LDYWQKPLGKKKGVFMSTVKQLLDEKGRRIYSVHPDATVFEALQMMAEKNVGGLLVVEGEKLLGIFSERDYARKVALKDRSSKEMRVSELMTKEIVCVNSDTTIEECMALMNERYIRHLPVVDDGKLVGIVTIRDIVHKIITTQKFTIRELEKYIYGTM